MGFGNPVFVPRLLGAAAGPAVARLACDRIACAEFNLIGWIGGYLSGVTEQWLKVAPFSNPAMLEIFRDRNREPLRDMEPWAGEFAGKYLTGAVEVYRLTRDPGLRSVIEKFVAELISLQGDDGYLGPWTKADQLTGYAENAGDARTKRWDRKTWDTWGHYHIMLGLLEWSAISDDQAALACARRIGDLICDTFQHKRLVDIGHSSTMNLAPIHSLCLLYARTGDRRYLRMAERIRGEFAAIDEKGEPLAGNYLEGPLAGKEFYELPGPRWEGLHSVLGLAELYALTGDDRSRQVFEKIWWSIVHWDRHNNGGFSSGEKACGNPYDKGAIETCCTIAWTALSVDMLRVTGDSVVADELELTTLNSITGMHSPNGRWVTYHTPMDGVRRASPHDIVFQARAGSPELNCCSVNGARGFGLIGNWALVDSPAGVTLNWYGPGHMTVPLAQGGRLTLHQETEYPRGNRVRLKIGLARPAEFSLRLRIPHWSQNTQVRLNSKASEDAKPGRYLVLSRTWTDGDVIDLDFDFTLQFWLGEREYEGKVSIYRGPILLTYDRRFNQADPSRVPALKAGGLSGKMIQSDSWLPPLLLLEFKAADGTALRLCDFASAGMAGSPYLSWLEVTGCGQTGFSRSNPRRSGPAL